MAETALDYAAMTEFSLAGLAAKGDSDAFHTIMKRCNQRLFRVARAVVGSDEEAEDVLQATYLSAFSAIGAFRADSSLYTWLTTITLNEARARLRKRRPTLELTVLEQDLASVIPFPGMAFSPDPETEAGRAQARAVLESAIDGLPSDFRVVFVLRELEGCTLEETAVQLAIPVATVKTRHFRAKRLLRRALEQRFVAGLGGVFPFLGERCDRICERVLKHLK